MTREDGYKRAFDLKRRALANKKALRDAKIASLKDENAEFCDINRKISMLGADIAETALSGDVQKISVLREQITALSKHRDQILNSAGIIDIEYDCAACLDTGYVDGKICDCIHNAAKAIIINELSASIPLGECRFENFDLNYYPTQAQDGTSPKKRMTQILKLCREYTLSFAPKTSESLLFLGDTGLGKTHLTLSIVNELLNKGFDVIYGAAYNLFSEMESEHFEHHTNEKYLAAINCDLLVIDDLGGEFVSPYIQSLFYNIINTRDLSGKPTVINTNLSMAQIGERYTPRVASRLLKYTAKKFIGNDIRQLKAVEKSNRK